MAQMVDFNFFQMSRGIANNNWLNIRHGNRWKGEVKGKDGGFESFSNPIWGLRAGIITTRNYKKRYGITTVRDWVNRWAPVEDNNPHNEAYIKHIERVVGQTINPYDYDSMRLFIRSASEFENGIDKIKDVWIDWYFELAWALAKK